MAKKHFIRIDKTRLLPVAGALFAIFISATGHAQSSNDINQLLNRINQLENQVQTMSRAVYRGDKSAVLENMPVSDGSASPSSVAGFEVRISQLEENQRAQTGRLEKVTFDLQQLKARVERMQADTEQRFQQGAAAGGGNAPTGNNMPTAIAQSPAANQLGTLAAGEGNSGPAETLYEDAFTSIREAKYDRAESGFKQFISQYPGHPLAPNAQYWLGETYYVRGDFQQAAKIFAQGYQNFPKSPKAEDSLLKLGLSLSRLGKKDDACLSLRQLQKEVSDESNPLRRRAVQEIKQLGCQ